ncbi:MAG: ATP-binding protein [Byssovorax sp.]
MSLFVGANNAGKTSVLEAIGLVGRPGDPGQWVQTATNRDASGPVVDGIWSLFPGSTALTLEGREETSAAIEIAAELRGRRRALQAIAQAFVEEWTGIDPSGTEAQPEALVRVNAEVHVEDGKHIRHALEFFSKQRRINMPPSAPPIRVFTITPYTHRSTQQLIVHLSHAIDEGVKAKSIELLRMFDPDVSDVVISRPFGRDAIRVMHEKKGVVDLATFGDGMRRAFAMSVALTRASGGLLLIDEIESTIHARALGTVLPWLVRAAAEADVQIVTTTHSLEAIDAVIAALAKEANETVVAFHLKRTEAGHQCRRYDLEGLRDFREEGLDIR